MRYLSVCSGIEAAMAAWHPLGFTPAGFAENAPFPSAVLAHHYPGVPNFGDFTKIEAADIGPTDILVGGTPCQGFSIAGLRKGLDDDRSNLALEFLRLADRTKPRWLLWENVPGALSTNGGRDFGAILGGLAELGYGFAWRILDAQFFGLAQRRKRLFLVGHSGGDWRHPAAVLFERESLSWHPAPRREPGKGTAPTISARPTGGGGLGTDFDLDGGLIAHALRREGHDASEDGTGRGTPIVVVGVLDCAGDRGGTAQDARSGRLIPFGGNRTSGALEVAPAINAKGGTGRSDFETEALIAFDCKAIGVRRLTVTECERLMGFPDHFTRIPVRTYARKPKKANSPRWADLYGENPDGTWTRYANDGPRYKALGNSMAVPVMRWLGERIALVDSIISQIKEAA